MPICWKCAAVVAELPEGDPGRQSERWGYAPAFVLEVIGGGPAGGGPCRCAVVCWACMHEINPDMWDAGEYWDARSPAVRFDALPLLDLDDVDCEDCWDVETYAGMFVKCLSNDGFPASLEVQKLYQRIPDEDAAKEGMVRVIDESGEDYLYPADRFSLPDGQP